MEAALAARATPLDRGALLRSARRDAFVSPNAAPARFAVRTDDLPPPVRIEPHDPSDGVTLPDVAGLPSRVAARRLHALGVRVAPSGLGEVAGTVPSAGARVLPGDTVRLHMRGSDR
jgi:hypothetical protein